MARSVPGLATSIPRLHVLSREFTGVGSFTKFKVDDPVVGTMSRIELGEVINIPGVPHGLIALLFLEEGKVELLEIVSCGDPWDGLYEGFSIGTAA